MQQERWLESDEPGCGEQRGVTLALMARWQMVFTPPIVYSNTFSFSGPLCFAVNKEHQSSLRDYLEMQLGKAMSVAQGLQH